MPTPDRLGKYVIRREIGRGAMGVVYEGWDPHIERRVAVKVLRLDEADPAHLAEIRLRFRREAQAAGRLAHPNIVSVYDYGEADDGHTAFIAMEMVAGRDLKTVFDSGRRFSVAEAASLTAALLAALEHAHQRGVVHRDIKPGNVLLLDDGGLKVADFGIAKLDASELTQTGAVLGTVSHMSPEQLAGRPVDRRTDVFSSAGILYQLLTGERPFTGSPATVMQKVLNEQPPAPSSRVADVPRALDAVVAKAMAKQPEQRYASADEFARSLAAALSVVTDVDTTVVQPGEGGMRQQRVKAAVLGGLAAAGSVVAGVVAWTLATRDAPVPQPASPSARLPASGVGLQVAATPAPPPVAPLPVQASPVQAPAVEPPIVQPAPERPAVVLPSAEEVEQSAWDDAVKASRIAAYEAYLKGYPNGRFAQRARVRIAALRPLPPAPAPMPAPLPAPAPAPAPVVVAVPPPVATVPASRPAVASAMPASRPAVVAAAPPSQPSVGGVTAPASRPAVVATAPASRPAGVAVGSEPGASRPSASVAAAKPFAPGRQGGALADACAAEARRQEPPCLVAQGLRLRSGSDGVPRDFAEAVRLFAKAAEQGYDVAQYELGLMHERGLGVPKNDYQAVAWFRKAAEQGHARAQTKLGYAHEHGVGAHASVALAAQWYGKAAEQGFAPAQANLGILYRYGRGVFKDTARATDLLQRAADRGDATAMFHLGSMAQLGEGQPRDAALAARWYRRALAGAGLSERNREAAAAYLARQPVP